MIIDWKTTSSYDHEDYFLTYELSPQLKTYYYALQYYMREYPETPLGRILQDNKGKWGAYIFGVFLSSTKEVEFKRSRLFWFPEKTMIQYEFFLSKLVGEIRGHYRMAKDDPSYLPFAEGSFNGSCTSERGAKCQFFKACAASEQQGGDDTLTWHVLRNNFIKREYNPLSFGGGKETEKQNETAV